MAKARKKAKPRTRAALASHIVKVLLDTVEQAGRIDGRKGKDRRLTLMMTITKDNQVVSTVGLMTAWVEEQLENVPSR